MRKTMMKDKQRDRQQTQKGRPVMRAKILQYGAAALLFLGLSVFQAGQAQAVINDHRSPDGTCNGVPEPPTPAGGICEVKLCTNDGDWMCCNKCTISGGYCCEQMLSMSRTQALRPHSGINMAPLYVQPSTTIQSPRSQLSGDVKRRGVEGDQPTEATPGCTCKGGNGTCTIDTVGTSGTCYKAQGNTCTGDCGWGSFRSSGAIAPQ